MAIIKIRNAAIDLDAAEIPNLPASKITSGTLNNARISLDAAEIPNLDTGKITTGTLADARVPNLNASKITAGTLADARVPNLNASKITAGTVAAARLGSGTANATTFLRGDGSYATPPVGGITNAQQWRITAAQQNMGNGDHVTNNWEQADSFGYGGIGSAMGQSQGIFTFPATGIWLVQFTYNGNDGSAQNYVGGIITATTNNSSYGEATQGNSSIQANGYFTGTINFMFDVTSTSTHKVRFAIHCATGQIALTGNTNRTDTGAVFIRLGDT